MARVKDITVGQRMGKIKRLVHTRFNPGEWIATTFKGRTIHIVAQKNKLRVADGLDLNSALRKAMKDEVEYVSNISVKEQKLSTEEMMKMLDLSMAKGYEDQIKDTPLDVDPREVER